METNSWTYSIRGLTYLLRSEYSAFTICRMEACQLYQHQFPLRNKRKENAVLRNRNFCYPNLDLIFFYILFISLIHIWKKNLDCWVYRGIVWNLFLYGLWGAAYNAPSTLYGILFGKNSIIERVNSIHCVRGEAQKIPIPFSPDPDEDPGPALR